MYTYLAGYFLLEIRASCDSKGALLALLASLVALLIGLIVCPFFGFL
jgi:hypothetical protein